MLFSGTSSNAPVLDPGAIAGQQLRRAIPTPHKKSLFEPEKRAQVPAGSKNRVYKVQIQVSIRSSDEHLLNDSG
jgi:hypothetical protein